MSHLYKFRKGWQSEHLAKYILSKFSFVAEPSTISDDLGSDFFCTLFKVENKDFLLPQNSFAIQIKSNGKMKSQKNKFEINNKKGYLGGLEIPFFIGVVDKEKLKLTIYSGEYISNYFSIVPDYPFIKKLFIHLTEKREEPVVMWEINKDKIYLKFPKVLDININYDYILNPEKIEDLQILCRLIQENIASKISNEFIFKRFNSIWVDIIAGPGSARTFRDNFLKRLAEIFYNLEREYSGVKEEDKPRIKQEFKIYKDLYLKLNKIYKGFPGYLVSIFDRVNNLIENG